MRAFWAGALSLLAPGLGHVYAGAYQRGLIGFLVQTGLALAIVGTTWGTFPSQVAVALTAAIVAALSSNWLFMSIDAARRAYRKPGLRSRWYRSTWIAAFACLASSAGIDEFGLGWRSFAVPSDSNLPNARSGDVIEAAVWRTPDLPQRGAMVAFRLPRYRTTTYMKRVIGLPGDRVQMKRGALWLNGAAVPRVEDRSMTQEVTAARVYFETLPGAGDIEYYNGARTGHSTARRSSSYPTAPFSPWATIAATARTADQWTWSALSRSTICSLCWGQ